MAIPISAYFGRRTYAFLDRCCFCGRLYDESGEWHTIQGSSMQGRGDNADAWLIVCDACLAEQEESED